MCDASHGNLVLAIYRLLLETPVYRNAGSSPLFGRIVSYSSGVIFNAKYNATDSLKIRKLYPLIRSIFFNR